MTSNGRGMSRHRAKGCTTSRRGIWGWMLFDWAAQPFFTVVTTFIFGPYFVSRMASDPAAGQAAWGYGIAAAGFVIAILSPMLGSIADQTGPRKPWIGFFAVDQDRLPVRCSGSPRPGSSLFLVVLFFSLASVAAEFSIVFNDSMMPRLVVEGRDRPDLQHRLGARLSRRHDRADLRRRLPGRVARDRQDDDRRRPALRARSRKLGEDARATGPLSALWYLVFILPMFLFTPDAAKGMPIGRAVRVGPGGTEVDARRGAPARRHPALPDRPHDLPGRRQRAAGAGRRLRGGDVRLVDHRDRHLRHHPQRRRHLRLPCRQPARHAARLEDVS